MWPNLVLSVALLVPLCAAQQQPPYPFPSEIIKYTGLSEEVLRKILDSRNIGAPNRNNTSGCAPATTFPAPVTGLSDADLVRRNEFVKRLEPRFASMSDV
jgi:hypothetical protein